MKTSYKYSDDLQVTTKNTPQTIEEYGRQGYGWRTVHEPFTGAWQRNIELRLEDILANPFVFRANNLISSDIAKMELCVQKRSGDIWVNNEKHPVCKLLRRPNNFQNRIQFVTNWQLSKLIFGNTYVLKRRDVRGAVTSMTVLHPEKVEILVSDSGEVFYRLSHDKLSQVGDRLNEMVTVPSTEMIHDLVNPLYHPLVGVSPLYAAHLSASKGINIDNASNGFFANNSQPGGLLIAPTRITEEDAKSLKDYWDNNFTGDNAGKIAVLGNDLQYTPLAVSANDSQLIDQLKWSADTIATVYGIPTYMLSPSSEPKYDNVQALKVEYYSRCLQIHIESMELLLHEGLGLSTKERINANLDSLLRMDGPAQMELISSGRKAGVYSPNEGRQKVNLKPVEGGEYPYLQQQDYSLPDLVELRRREAENAERERTLAEAPVEPQEPELSEEDVMRAVTKHFNEMAA